MSINIKKIIQKKNNETNIKIIKQELNTPSIATGSFSRIENETSILSSLTNFIKNGELICADKSLKLLDNMFIPTSLADDFEIYQTINASNGFNIKENDIEIKISPIINSSLIGKISNTSSNTVEYEISDTSVLNAIVKENGLDISWNLTSYSSLSTKQLRREYNLACSNCKANYDAQNGIIIFTDNEGHDIYHLVRPYIIDGLGKTYRNCGYNFTGSDVINGSFYVYINSKWLTSVSPILPIRLIMPILKTQNYVITLKNYRNNYLIDPVDGICTIGRRNSTSYSLDIKVDTESIIKDLVNRDLKRFHIELNLYYRNGSRLYDTPGFVITCKGEKISTENYNSEEGNINLDISKYIYQEYKSWLNGGYTPKTLSITINYYSSIKNWSYINPTLADNDYIEIYDIDYNDSLKRPNIAIIKEDDGSVLNGTPLKQINVGEAGTATINLFNGNLFHDISLGTFIDGNLSIPVSLHYDNRLLNTTTSFKNGWMLSFERKLIKDTTKDKTLGEKRTAYLDGSGNKHYLEETWFYKEGKVKHLLDKKYVYLDNDQKLKFDVLDSEGNILETKEVEYEISNDECLYLISSESENYLRKQDLKLNSSKSTIKYKIGYRQFEVKGISNGEITVKGYYQLISALDEDLSWTKDFLEAIDNEKVVKFINPQDVRFISDKPYYLNTSTALNEMDINITFIADNGGIVLLFPKYRIYLNSEGENFGDEYIEHEFYEYPAQLNKVFSIATEDVETYKTNEDIQNIDSQLKQIESSINQISETLKSCRANLNLIKSQIAHIKISAELNNVTNTLQDKLNETSDAISDNTTSDYINARDAYQEAVKNQAAESNQYSLISITAQKETLISQIKTYNNQLFDLLVQKENNESQKEALIKESKEGATDYLIDENGNYLIFDYDGKLISIVDQYENSIEIIYEEEKITRIQGKANNALLIHYNEDNLPEYMQLQDGRRIEFKYINNQLVNVSFLKEKGRITNIQFSYETDNMLSLIVSNLLKKAVIEYEDKKAVKINTYCLASEISSSIVTSNKELKDERYEIKKTDTGTIFKDLINDVDEEYFIDFNGRLITTIISNGKRIDYAFSHYNNDGQIYSLNCIYHDTNGKAKDKIAEFNFSDDVVNEASKEIQVYEKGSDTAYGRIYRNKLKEGSLIALIQKLEASYLTASNLFSFSIEVVQYNDKEIIETSSFTFDEIKYGFVVAPFRLNEKTTKVLFKISSDNGTFDFSKLEKARIYNVTGSVNIFDDEGRIIRTESNKGIKEYASFYKKMWTISTFKNNYGRSKKAFRRLDGNGRIILTEDYDNNCVAYSYDDSNRLIEKKEYNSKDPTACTKTNYTYSSKGIVTETSGEIKDDDGNYPSYLTESDAYTGLLIKEIYPNGQSIIHGYDANSFDEIALSSDDEGRANLTFKEYNYGYLTKLSHEGATFSYTYDGYGRKTSISLNDNKLVSYEYKDARNDTTLASTYQSTIKASDIFSYTSMSTYDRFNRLITNEYGDYSFNYDYDEEGNLLKEEDANNGIYYEYTYDKNNKVLTTISKDSNYILKSNNEYDSYQRLSKEEILINDVTYYSSQYFYDEEDKLISSSITSDALNITSTYSYDTRNQIKIKSLAVNNINLNTNYEYLRQDEHALGLVVNYSLNINEENYINEKFNYDVSGNITKINKKDGDIEYSYDKLNRLIKETNKSINKTIEYSYDNAGNLVEKLEYDGANENKNLIKSIVLTYNNYSWRDQVTSIKVATNNDNKKYDFSYDDLGRLIKYADKTLSWNKDGTLASVDENIFYTYNSKGLRISKTIDGNKEEYVLFNGNVLRIVKQDGNIDFIYSNEKIEGFTYKDNKYLYIRNLFNDVIGIIDISLNKVVAKYIYDAYGRQQVYDENNTLVIDFDNTITNEYKETIIDFIGYINPLRYRGYFYDNETNLYYLNSRYYDPNTCRFISPDVFSILDETRTEINGLNLYMYCSDNPIMNVDPSGHDWNSFWSGVGNWFKDNWIKIAIGAGAIVLGALTMGVASLISGAGIAAALSVMGTATVSSLVQVGISTVVSAGISLAVGGITTGSWSGALNEMINGIADGLMWGGIFAGAGQVLSGAMKITRTLAPNFNGFKIEKIKLWSPNSVGNPNAGGTILKFGHFNRIDAEIGNMIHIHLKMFGYRINHFPIGSILGGIFGGLHESC